MLIFIAVYLPRFVMNQYVTLSSLIHNGNIVLSEVDWFYPIACRINDYRDASTIPAARDQHRHQEDD